MAFRKSVSVEIKEKKGNMMDFNHTFVTSNHHFCTWKNYPLHEGSEQHIALWDGLVGMSAN